MFPGPGPRTAYPVFAIWSLDPTIFVPGTLLLWSLIPMKIKPMVLVLIVVVAGSSSQMSLVPGPPFRASSLKRFMKYLI